MKKQTISANLKKYRAHNGTDYHAPKKFRTADLELGYI
jgi:hypothetical protein